MKKKFLNKCIRIIKNSRAVDMEEELVIRYGLESLYNLITKFVVITIIAILLGLFVEYILFMGVYNIVRLPSFGIHAKKSWMCWISSTLIFLIVPYICINISLSNYIISLVGIICILLFFKNAPADTEKRPIVNLKRRLVYKYLSVFICIIFTGLSLMVSDNFLSNCFIFALLVQSFMISPLIYKLFNLKYDNYKTYLEAI